jgi:hypothetical protein
MLNFISPYATQFTREKHAGKRNPQISMWNRKPYRTKAQKQRARQSAAKGHDGAYRSPAPTSMHPIPRPGSPR